MGEGQRVQSPSVMKVRPLRPPADADLTSTTFVSICLARRSRSASRHSMLIATFVRLGFVCVDDPQIQCPDQVTDEDESEAETEGEDVSSE